MANSNEIYKPDHSIFITFFPVNEMQAYSELVIKPGSREAVARMASGVNGEAVAGTASGVKVESDCMPECWYVKRTRTRVH